MKILHALLRGDPFFGVLGMLTATGHTEVSLYDVMDQLMAVLNTNGRQCCSTITLENIILKQSVQDFLIRGTLYIIVEGELKKIKGYMVQIPLLAKFPKAVANLLKRDPHESSSTMIK